MNTYIHYGSDHFCAPAFIPVRNGNWRPKPADGTGLWASRENDKYGWEAWCRENKFDPDHLKHSFRFTLPDAAILTLEDPNQLTVLPKLHPWEPKKPLEVAIGEMPTLEQLQEWFVPNWCYLDFEQLAKQYDAIELRNSGAFRSCLGTWDCDCLLVLKADRIVEL